MVILGVLANPLVWSLRGDLLEVHAHQTHVIWPCFHGFQSSKTAPLSPPRFASKLIAAVLDFKAKVNR